MREAGHVEAIGWLRDLLQEAREAADRLRAEAAWRRGLLETEQQLTADQAAQLAARAEQVAWLEGNLAARDAALAAALAAAALEQAALDLKRAAQEERAEAAEARAAAAEARAHRAEQGEHAAKEKAGVAQADLARVLGSLSWRITRPLRFLRARVAEQPGPPPSPPLLEPAPPSPSPPAPAPAAEPPPIPAPEPPEPPPEPEPEPARPEPEPIPPPAPPEPPAPAAPPAPVRPLHVVHQFHAGSGPGDAVTNAMFLIRGLLRAMGYQSDIFAEHVHEALTGEVKPVDALPQHDGYVLLAHHSMGFTTFERIVALPAAKVLVYHNITPPELLTETPYAPLARLGRDQLAAWQPRAVAALADSEYNAIELRSLGFDPVRSCTLLFDLDLVRQRVTTTPRNEAIFTILFVAGSRPPRRRTTWSPPMPASARATAKPPAWCWWACLMPTRRPIWIG